MTSLLPDRRPAAQHAASRHREHPATRRLNTAAIVGAALALVSLAVLIFPSQLERAVGETKVAVEAVVQDFVAREYPTVVLGPLGGEREMDWCDGRFIEMESYRIDGVPPVYAGHVNCGVDFILSWEIGDLVKVEGRDTIYEVVEERHTRKWANIDSLRGMSGELVLQTCYWGQDKMRFLALEPVHTPTPAGGTPRRVR